MPRAPVPYPPLMSYTYADLAKMIDHSLLNPTLAASDLEAGCKLALAYDVASVCIMPYYLRRCAEMLRGSTVMASTPTTPRRSPRRPFSMGTENATFSWLVDVLRYTADRWGV